MFADFLQVLELASLFCSNSNFGVLGIPGKLLKCSIHINLASIGAHMISENVQIQ